MSDYQIAVDTLREDVSGDAELVTVAAADVRAVLARLEALEAAPTAAAELRRLAPGLHRSDRMVLEMRADELDGGAS